MSKYQPLADFLAAHTPDTWKATFAEVEAALGSALPKTAREKLGWWSEANKPHSVSWTGAGWAVDSVDLEGGSVVFKRAASSKTAHDVMTAADAAYGKVKVAETAAKAGIVAAVAGAFGVVVGLGLSMIGRKK